MFSVLKCHQQAAGRLLQVQKCRFWASVFGCRYEGDFWRVLDGFCDTRFDVRHAPTLPRPQRGRESPPPDGFRCCELVQ